MDTMDTMYKLTKQIDALTYNSRAVLIKRIREQIRVWKPIQVVFRDILLRYVGEIELKASITGPIVGLGEFGTAIGLGDDEVVEPEYLDPALTNCAF